MTSAFGDQASPMMTSANNVGEGWHPLIKELEEKLNAIDPNYELLQVKEKFGGLRYYANTFVTEREAQELFHLLIAEAEEASFHICEVCGEPGEQYSSKHGWLKTLCATHQAERLASQVHS
jgi:hypothetical protein